MGSFLYLPEKDGQHGFSPSCSGIIISAHPVPLGQWDWEVWGGKTGQKLSLSLLLLTLACHQWPSDAHDEVAKSILTLSLKHKETMVPLCPSPPAQGADISSLACCTSLRRCRGASLLQPHCCHGRKPSTVLLTAEGTPLWGMGQQQNHNEAGWHWEKAQGHRAGYKTDLTNTW